MSVSKSVRWLVCWSVCGISFLFEMFMDGAYSTLALVFVYSFVYFCCFIYLFFAPLFYFIALFCGLFCCFILLLSFVTSFRGFILLFYSFVLFQDNEV